MSGSRNALTRQMTEQMKMQFQHCFKKVLKVHFVCWSLRNWNQFDKCCLKPGELGTAIIKMSGFNEMIYGNVWRWRVCESQHNYWCYQPGPGSRISKSINLQRCDPFTLGPSRIKKTHDYIETNCDWGNAEINSWCPMDGNFTFILWLS